MRGSEMGFAAMNAILLPELSKAKNSLAAQLENQNFCLG